MKSIPSVPLFEQLYVQTESLEEDLSGETLQDICQTIKIMDEEGCEMVFILLSCYHVAQENGTLETLPYSPKISKAGFRYDMKQLPSRLVKMLYCFTELYKKKMEEETTRCPKKK